MCSAFSDTAAAADAAAAAAAALDTVAAMSFVIEPDRPCKSGWLLVPVPPT
jgi:hypothetical protein